MYKHIGNILETLQNIFTHHFLMWNINSVKKI